MSLLPIGSRVPLLPCSIQHQGQRSVPFSLALNALRRFGFSISAAGFFSLVCFSDRQYFFQDRCAVGTRRLIDLPLSRFCPRRSSCNNRFSAAIERSSITARIAFDPRHSPATPL